MAPRWEQPPPKPPPPPAAAALSTNQVPGKGVHPEPHRAPLHLPFTNIRVDTLRLVPGLLAGSIVFFGRKDALNRYRVYTRNFFLQRVLNRAVLQAVYRRRTCVWGG